LAFQQFNYNPKKPQIEYITREQDENRDNTSDIGPHKAAKSQG